VHFIAVLGRIAGNPQSAEWEESPLLIEGQ
jgi:hypothetical protein